MHKLLLVAVIASLTGLTAVAQESAPVPSAEAQNASSPVSAPDKQADAVPLNADETNTLFAPARFHFRSTNALQARAFNLAGTDALHVSLFDADGTNCQSSTDPSNLAPCSQSTTPTQWAPGTYSTSKPKSAIHWKAFFGEWAFDVAFEQGERLIMEPKTRAELNGPYFKDWFYVVSHYRYGTWDDSDKFFTSNIAHPAQGAVVEAIFWQNNDNVRFKDQDFHDPAYRKALLQAFAFAAIDAVQWKLGPFSEATIGHVGLPTPEQGFRNRTGLNDLVMNEVGGTAMTIGFQWVDKHLQKPLESHIQNHTLINTTRIFTNPPASLANIFRFKAPWYRDNRDAN
jgi:hypothetical protein